MIFSKQQILVKYVCTFVAVPVLNLKEANGALPKRKIRSRTQICVNTNFESWKIRSILRVWRTQIIKNVSGSNTGTQIVCSYTNDKSQISIVPVPGIYQYVVTRTLYLVPGTTSSY